MINDRDKYIKDIKNNFLSQNEKEQQQIDHLVQRIFDYYNDNKNAVYSDYVEQFGTPNEIVMSYFENIGANTPIRKVKKEPWLKLLYFIIAICIIIYFFFATASFLEGRNHYIGGYNEKIIE